MPAFQAASTAGTEGPGCTLIDRPADRPVDHTDVVSVLERNGAMNSRDDGAVGTATGGIQTRRLTILAPGAIPRNVRVYCDPELPDAGACKNTGYMRAMPEIVGAGIGGSEVLAVDDPGRYVGDVWATPYRLTLFRFRGRCSHSAERYSH